MTPKSAGLSAKRNMQMSLSESWKPFAHWGALSMFSFLTKGREAAQKATQAESETDCLKRELREMTERLLARAPQADGDGDPAEIHPIKTARKAGQ